MQALLFAQVMPWGILPAKDLIDGIRFDAHGA